MALVFKVKFQDTLRRWVATEALNADSFSINFEQLEAKIKELFHLSPSASLVITYVDYDRDVVTLADDQDLIDACVVQRLNPLRLDVQVLGGNSKLSDVAQELPRSLDTPMSADNVNIEAFLNALFPQATADAVKGFLRTYTPFIDPKLPAAACLGKAENAFKEFLNFTEKFAPHHRNKHECPAMSNPRSGGTSFHWAIECDGCGMSPIEGVRYKSTKETNYDLCAGCFKTIGNENDYEKLDRPVYHPPHSHYRPPCFKRGPRPFPAPPGCRATFARGQYGWKPNHPFAGHQGSGSSASDEHKKLDARFVKDVTIFDGTELSPGTKFTKIWRMSNIGSLPWPRSTQLVHIGGDVLCAEETVALELPEGGLPCGEEVEVSVDLTAPEKAGRYVSHWRLTAPFGQKFGHRVWAVIHVVPHGEHSPQFQASLQNNNSSVEVNKEAMDVDLDGANTVTMDVDLNGANKVVLDVVIDGETAAIEQVSVEKSGHNDHENAHPLIVYPDPSSHGLKDVGISTEKSLEVGVNNTLDPLIVYPDPSSHGLTDVGMSTEQSSEEGVNTLVVVYPDATSPVYPDATSHDMQDVSMSTKKSSEGANRKFEVDGFSLVERPTESPGWFEIVDDGSFFGPKEGEQVVDAAGWDGVLKDLEEMGFNEKATNRRLLVKNKGSLKQTVRDLVKMEKQVVKW